MTNNLNLLSESLPPADEMINVHYKNVHTNTNEQMYVYMLSDRDVTDHSVFDENNVYLGDAFAWRFMTDKEKEGYKLP